MSFTPDKRYWMGGGALVAVLIAAAAWFMVISPQLSSASSLRDQAGSARAQNSVLESKIGTLKQQNDNLSKLTAKLQAAIAALPFDSGLPAFTRQLASQAAQHRIALTSIAVGSIRTASGAPEGTTGAATTATTGSADAAGGLFAIPVTLLSTGTAKNQLAFLEALQANGPRRALVTSTTVTPGSGSATASIDGSSTMTTQLTVFTAPLSTQAQAQLEKLLSGDVAH